jgi:hypothetical protein
MSSYTGMKVTSKMPSLTRGAKSCLKGAWALSFFTVWVKGHSERKALTTCFG